MFVDGNCVQTITHPAISVWSVAVNAENGDIATGASDNVVRVFSRDQSKWATKELLAVGFDVRPSVAITNQNE
jgi:phospholipase A-2-activating protein